MAIQRGDPLYPVNTTTVDTGAGIDVRLLDSAEGGADDSTQTAQFTNTEDSVERTFDPATGAVTNTNNAGTTLFKAGWALRLTEDMTPTDDTNCDAILKSGTIAVSLNVNANQAGGTYASGTFGPTFRASLWRYNPSLNTGTLIAAGSTTATTWNVAAVGGDLGTAKTATFNISVPSNVTFGAASGAAAEVLYLQVGFNTGTVPDPTLGTGTFTVTLTVDNTNTKIDFAAGQGIRQSCAFTTALVGIGTPTRAGESIQMSKTTVGIGTVVGTKATIAAKSFAIVGKGVAAHQKSIALPNGSVVGKGTTFAYVNVPYDEIPDGGGGGTTTVLIAPIFD